MSILTRSHFHRLIMGIHFVVKRKEGFIVMVMAVFHPLLSLIAGILILLMPRLLNYIVAIYLIVIGVSGLVR